MLTFEFEPFGEGPIESAQRRVLDPLHGQRRALTNLLRDRLAACDQLIHRHHVINETQAQRFLRPDTIAGVEHLERAAEWNQARQALRSAAAREPSEAHLAQTELRVIGRDPNVTGE